MKTSIFSPNDSRRAIGIFFTMLMAILLFGHTTVLAGKNKSQATPGLSKDPIQVTADSLVSNTESHVAEFSGNVVVTQGSSTITANRIKIFYSGDLGSKENSSSAKDGIRKIKAIGNVKIKFDDKKGNADTAEYDTETGILTLSGNPTKVSSGKNYVTGGKIVYDRTKGTVKVVAKRKRRVEAVFFAPAKGKK